MNLPRRRNPFAFLLLLALLVPILAACGGTAATTPTAAPADTQATTAATEPTTAATEAAETEATEEPTEAVTEEATETATDTAAAAGTGDEDAVSPGGNVLRVNFSEPENIDPQKASFVDEIAYIMLNYQPLMNFDEELNVVPAAAESYELSEDGTVFTFKLHPDLTYSDGEPLTAENFEYGWKRLCDPITAGEYAAIAFPVVGCEEYFSAFDSGSLTVTDEAELQALRDKVGVEAVDESTLTITLKESTPYFLNVAALWVGAPVRQDLVEAGGESWWSDPANYIGNGPFQLTEWEPQSRVRFERNENFVGEAATIEAIEGTQSEDTAVIFQAYQSDELDIIGLAAEDEEAVRNDPELLAQRVETPGSCSSYIGFNTTRPPFDNKDVRLAFARGFDREAWVRDILQGHGLPALSFIPPGIPGHDPSLTQQAYDPEAAKQALQDAGFDFDQELKITYAASARGKARLEWIAAQFQNALGVTMTLDPVEPTAYTALLKEEAEKLPLIFTAGWCADYPDPQNYLSLVFGPGGIGAGRTGWANEQFTDLTSRADKMPIDDPEREKLYAEAQSILTEEAPVVHTTYTVDIRLIKPWVQGIRESLTPLDYFPGIFNLSGWSIRHE